MNDEKVVSKKALAAKLGVSRSSLYYQPKKPPKDEGLAQRIRALHQEHPAYGHRRIAIALSLNKKRILRVMRKKGISPKIRRNRPKKSLDEGQAPTTVPNLAKMICPIRANVLWAGDFTYLAFGDRFLYVATVIDIFTREIIGWHIAWHHTADLIIRAFKDALRRRNAVPNIFHSDQGSEYVSGAYAKVLARHGVAPSQSKKASPWENGFQESFYSQFKLELGDLRRFGSAGALIVAVHAQLHYYNTKRIHTALKMPPRQFYVTKTIAIAAAVSH